MAGSGDLVLYQGDDFLAVVRIVDGDGEEVAIDAFTAQAQIRRNYADEEDESVALTCTVQSPRVLIGLARADSVKLAGRYRWDMQLVDADGTTTTVIAGGVTVTPEVTR